MIEEITKSEERFSEMVEKKEREKREEGLGYEREIKELRVLL